MFDIKNYIANRIAGIGSKQLPKPPENEIGFVLVSRSYGLTDPVLSLSIKQKLTSLGYKVYDLPRANNLQNFPRLSDFMYEISEFGRNTSDVYWPFGKEVLTAAKLLRDIPNLYPIYLTYHAADPIPCSPTGLTMKWEATGGVPDAQCNAMK